MSEAAKPESMPGLDRCGKDVFSSETVMFGCRVRGAIRSSARALSHQDWKPIVRNRFEAKPSGKQRVMVWRWVASREPASHQCGMLHSSVEEGGSKRSFGAVLYRGPRNPMESK